jgi:protein TonB
VRRKLEGRLRLGVTIGPDGRIVSVRVLSSSGHAVLDESATASVTALDIPPPPEALHWREREISLPIRYALD